MIVPTLYIDHTCLCPLLEVVPQRIPTVDTGEYVQCLPSKVNNGLCRR